MDFTGGLPWQQAILFYFLFIWALLWKGIALWRAANLKQRNWFVVILILNTFGILEIIYLFRFSTKRMTIGELKNLFRNMLYFKNESK